MVRKTTKLHEFENIFQQKICSVYIINDACRVDGHQNVNISVQTISQKLLNVSESTFLDFIFLSYKGFPSFEIFTNSDMAAETWNAHTQMYKALWFDVICNLVLLYIYSLLKWLNLICLICRLSVILWTWKNRFNVFYNFSQLWIVSF